MTAGARARDFRSGQGRTLLLALLGSPVAWVAHLLLSYLIVTLWCSSKWAGVELAIGILTLVCAVAALAAGVLAYRLWKQGPAGTTAAFVAVLGLLMSALFGFLIVLEGLPPLFARVCPLLTAS
jgi:hypothetical protein